MLKARLVVLLLLAGAGCATAPTPSIDPQIAASERATGGMIAVASFDLESGRHYNRNERESMHAASTMKVPVMLALFDAMSRGELRLDQPVLVKNEFQSIFDGSIYALESKEDSDTELY